MKAIFLKDFGGVENFEMKDIPVPAPGDDEVIVQVKAVSINPVDAKSRAGKGLAGRIKQFMPLILGWDISGVVTSVGSSVRTFKEGDEVFGMVNFPGHGKAYAEYVAAPASHLAIKPSGSTHQEAAAATLAALTAWQALVTHAKIKAGDKVLVHAASGGVGHYAVQIAKHFGAFAIGTSSATNKDFILSLGADEHIDYTSTRFENEVRDADIVLDCLGAEHLERSVDATKAGGTIISILGTSDQANEKAKKKNVHLEAFLVSSNGEHMNQIAKLMTAGSLRSHIDQVFPMRQIGDAHTQLDKGRTRGKIVLAF